MGGGHGAEPRVRRALTSESSFAAFSRLETDWGKATKRSPEYDAPWLRKGSFGAFSRQETDWGESNNRSPEYDAPWVRRAPLAHPLAPKQIGGSGKAEPEPEI